MMYWMISLLLSLGLTPLVIVWAHRRRWLDIPDDPRKIHQRPTPRLGSFPIFVAWAVSLGISKMLFSYHGLLRLWLVAAFILVLVGLLDDLGKMHSQIKLFVAMPLAAFVVMQHPEVRLYFLPFELGNLMLTFLWLVGITAAFNLLDGVDGLVSGVSALTIFSFSLMSALSGQEMMARGGWMLLGSVLGFLAWNFPPARIFLGDGGAMLLGFSAALLGIVARFDLPQSVSWTLPAIMLGLPIFDTTLVTIMRLRQGKIPFATPGRDHTHHRLLALGWSTRRVTLTLWGVTAFLNAMGLGLWWLRPPYWVYLVVFAGVVIIAALLAWWLVRMTQGRVEMQ